jgi:nucleotide-binding universal stress UspA family protein
MFRDLLVPLLAGPDPTDSADLDTLIAAASVFGGVVSGVAVEVDLVQTAYMYSDAVVFLADAVREAEESNHAFALGQIGQFADRAAAAGLTCDVETVRTIQPEVVELLAERARLHDLTLFTLGAQDVVRRTLVEGVAFGSGRPVLAIPRGTTAMSADHVLVAWDYSREAARAVADAMPILRKAAHVTVVHIADTATSRHRQAATLGTHFRRQDIPIHYEQVVRNGQTTYEIIKSEAHRCGADLIVMGAYGHARLREFVLGGATRGMLQAPFLPVLMSH